MVYMDSHSALYALTNQFPRVVTYRQNPRMSRKWDYFALAELVVAAVNVPTICLDVLWLRLQPVVSQEGVHCMGSVYSTFGILGVGRLAYK
jgi:hypothetical protein